MFNPEPASNAFFSHELLHTLLGSCRTFKNSWNQIYARVLKDDGKLKNEKANALESIAEFYRQHKVMAKIICMIKVELKKSLMIP